MSNPNPKTDHLKKTQFQNLPTDKKRAIARKAGKASIKAKKKKKEEEKEKQKFADIFNIILETKIKDEKTKKIIKEKYPTLEPNNKTLVAVEHFARMFKKSIETTKNGITITKKINDQNFIKFQEYVRDTIGEKPIDRQENVQRIYDISISKEDLKEAKNNLIKELNSKNL